MAVDPARAASAILFMQGGLVVFDVMSAVNSSPWTAESFGADPRRAAALREYVTHGVMLSAAYGVGSAWIAGSWWPVVGTAAGCAYMVFLYERAVARAQQAGSDSWSDGTS